jgi:murein DD-endopeptidase MepM/ murein hydrolase activator NlpD
MSDSLKERTWAFLCATFPERQIYIRSDGRVQFFVFGPLMQTILAGITLLFLGWVAFTSVNVIFKDRIIATKDRRFQEMQSSYEARVADLQLSYDELNGVVVSTEDRVKSVLDSFQNQQNALADIIEHKHKLETALGVAQPVPDTNALVQAAPDSAASADDDADAGAQPLDGAEPAMPAPPASASGFDNALTPSVAQPAPKVLPPKAALPPGLRRQSFLRGTVNKLSVLFARKTAAKTAAINNPALIHIASEEKRVDGLKTRELALLSELNGELNAQTGRYRQALKIAGVNADALMKQNGESKGVGGPLIPLPASFTKSDQGEYLAHLSDAQDSLSDLDDLVKAMSAVPLVRPVIGAEFEQSSGFGVRRDPFTKQLAFHSGLDFSGPTNSPVLATAPGVVVFAGERSGYGNTVEIDHGHGIRTRYGHLRSILVSVGSKIAKGAPVGKLGSTGRSTGPHVHYEVWYGNAARDPSNFLKAGRYVLQE